MEPEVAEVLSSDLPASEPANRQEKPAMAIRRWHDAKRELVRSALSRNQGNKSAAANEMASAGELFTEFSARADAHLFRAQPRREQFPFTSCASLASCNARRFSWRLIWRPKQLFAY